VNSKKIVKFIKCVFSNSAFMRPPSVVRPQTHNTRLHVCPDCPLRVCPETLLRRYLEKYLTDFHQTYVTDALWDRDERVKFCENVKVNIDHKSRKEPVCSFIVCVRILFLFTYAKIEYVSAPTYTLHIIEPWSVHCGALRYPYPGPSRATAGPGKKSSRGPIAPPPFCMS